MSEFDQEINLDEVLEEMKRLQAEQESEVAKFAALKKQLDEAERAVRLMRREAMDAERNINARRMSIRDIEKKKERALRLQLAKDRRDQILRDYETKAAQLDALTADLIWRVGNADGNKAFPHQIDGGKRLAVAKRGILADKRGLGKTLTGLVWADMVEAKRILVIAPNDIVSQFEDEIRTWAPDRKIFSLAGKPPEQRAIIYPMLNMVKEFIVTLNYEAWRRDKKVIDDLVSAGIDTVICDEAHKIKSSTKITARGVFQVVYRPNYCKNCDKVKNYMGPWVQANGTAKDYNVNEMTLLCESCSGQLSSTVENVLSMTGTPFLNRPQELFSLLYLVDCTTYSSERKFLDTYCYSAGPNRWRFMPGGLSRLTKHMSEFFIQRSREDAGIQVPPPDVKVYYIEKDKTKYKKQYEAERILRNNAAMILESGETFSMLYQLEILLRERQLMTWPAGVELKLRDDEGEVVDTLRFDVEESQKVDEACELLKDLMDEEERVIVFSKFKAPLYEMHRRFSAEGIRSVVATGDQSKEYRAQVRSDFDLKTAPESPRWQVAFATYEAFGTGINLNAARHMILLDDEWSPGMEDQAVGRIDRLNSVDQANVHVFRVKDSVDEFMESLIEEKKNLTEGFEVSLTKQRLIDHLRGE